MNRRFLRSLYEEHLEEISALYERRLGYLDDSEIDLDDLVALEARIEGHLDALVVGAEPALEFCAERAADGDAGELFGAISVFCRQGRHDLIEAALARVEEEDDDEPEEVAEDEDEEDEELDGGMMAKAAAEAEADEQDEDDDDEDDDDEGPTAEQAVADALRFEAPGAAWQPLYEKLLAHSHEALRALIVPLAATRGLAVGPQILEAAGQEHAGPRLGPMLWALGRMRERSATKFLGQHAQRTDSEDAAIATLALLRFGDTSVLDHVLRLVPNHPWAVSLVAISGGVAHGPIIRSRLARAEVVAEEVIAAGLFGDLSAVPRLLECLDEGVHPEAAAQALYLLTGASQYETVIEDVEEIDSSEVTDEEPSAEVEPDPRDKVEIERLSEDPVAWRAWWEEHQGAFERGKRYRLGQLVSPVVLGETLTRFVLRRAVRQLAAEEIGLRYWPQTDLDVDMQVPTFRAALAGLPSLQKSDAVIARADGAWVFARTLAR